MKISKRELIDLVRDAYVEGYMAGGELEYLGDFIPEERDGKNDFRSAEVYWALRERLGLDNG